MVLIRKIIILSFLLVSISSFGQNQLIFTDNYQTNIFTSSENIIRFNNNYFAIIDSDYQKQILSLIDTFFQEIAIEATLLPQEEITQYKFALVLNDSEDYLKWSKIWHQKYQSKLNELFGEYSKQFSTSYALNYSKLELALLTKSAYYFYKNYKNRKNEFSNTRLAIQVNNLSANKFLKNNIEPNNSLNRIITNSFPPIYNEKLAVLEVDKPTLYYYGPTSKSRLIDCLSMHVYCNYYNLDAPKYYVNSSYFPSDTSKGGVKDLKQIFNQSLKELLKVMSDPSIAFYNTFDQNNIKLDSESYISMGYLESFKEIYIQNKKYTGFNNDDQAILFNLYSIQDSIIFKSNSIKYQNETDSLKLEKVAAFLLENPNVKINIYGKANKSEYTKIEKKEYLHLIQKYQEYNPVKISKRVDLSLYRALVTFVKLESFGVSPLKMECTSKIIKNGKASQQNVSFQIIQLTR